MSDRLSPKQQLSRNVSFMRSQLGLTREKLAEYVGATGQSIAAIEKQRTGNPGVFTIKAIALFFGMSTDELTGTDIRKMNYVRHTFRRAEQTLGDMNYEDIHFLMDTINKEIIREAKKGKFRKRTK